MCPWQLVGLESSFAQRIAPTGPVLTVPHMPVNAGLLLEAYLARRHTAVCCCGPFDLANDMVAIHVCPDLIERLPTKSGVQAPGTHWTCCRFLRSTPHAPRS